MSVASPPSSDEPASRRWTSQGLALNYHDWGNPGAPVLLLLHGNGDQARSWDAAAKALSGEWHVIAPDWRGHGDSQWSPDGAYATAYFVMELADLIDYLNVQRVAIVAHSFGGVVALRYAAMFPERVHKLVVVDGHGPPDSARERWSRQGDAARTREWIEKRRQLASREPSDMPSIEEAARRLQKNRPRLSDTGAQALARHAVKPTETGFAWKRDPLVGAFLPEDFAQETGEVWQRITAGTLFLYARESWKYEHEVRELERHFRDATGYVFENAGHWLHHDQPDEFFRVVGEFLDS